MPRKTQTTAKEKLVVLFFLFLLSRTDAVASRMAHPDNEKTVSLPSPVLFISVQIYQFYLIHAQRSIQEEQFRTSTASTHFLVAIVAT